MTDFLGYSWYSDRTHQHHPQPGDIVHAFFALDGVLTALWTGEYEGTPHGYTSVAGYAAEGLRYPTPAELAAYQLTGSTGYRHVRMPSTRPA